MGILFQKSCFQVPDAKFRAIDPGRITKNKKQKLQGRRRKQLNGIVDEARAWMYAIMLPTQIVANGDRRIKRNLDEQIAKLTIKILGSKINHAKITQVCHKIANNILIPGVANIELGASNSTHYPDPPPPCPYDMMARLLDNRHMTAGYLEKIYDECEDFHKTHYQLETWAEIREVAEPYSIKGKPLLDLLDEWQERMTLIEYGMPHLQVWTEDVETDIKARIRSAQPSRLVDFTSEQRDLILICAGGREPRLHALAEVNGETNVMVTHPLFFNEAIPDSLREVPMRDHRDRLHNTFTRVAALLHELTHSKDVLFARDHEFQYYAHPHPRALECIWGNELYPSASGRDWYSAYGLEGCLALVRRDELMSTNKAEDNADSWAIYFTLRVLLLAYPEIDSVSALEDNGDLFVMPARKVFWRDELLHHCTLFQSLRHPDCDEFPKRTLDYNESKDWCKQPRNWMAPTTVKDLLTLLQVIYKPE